MSHNQRFGQHIGYTEGQNEYIFQLTKHRNRWWLLLLLLPLLLLIRCERDITVHAFDADNGCDISDAKVTVDYHTHYLFKDMRLFHTEHVVEECSTDSDGKAYFRKLPCSVFSYIFYCLSKATVTAEHPCYETTGSNPYFHWVRNVDMSMPPLYTDLYIKVIDDQTEEPIAGATVTYIYNKEGRTVTDTVTANARGEVTIEHFRTCSEIDELCGSAYGYADTCRTEVAASLLRRGSDSAILRLRPIMMGFTFFVKNVENGEPIPGATAEVTITDDKAHVNSGTSTTNVDGQGKGYYDEAFMLAHISIRARKVHFNDSTLNGDYTVEEFCRLPDSLRVVWLRPLPYVEMFENIDSITGKPIAGVTNKITVTDPSGNVETYTEMSNRNGKFPVKAKAGSKIEISSTLDPKYLPKQTTIIEFKDAQQILMEPRMIKCSIDLVFCIDNTGSMWGNLAEIKRNAVSFPEQLQKHCQSKNIDIKELRIKVIGFGDYAERAFDISEMFTLPEEKVRFVNFVQSLPQTTGCDGPEDSLDALTAAMNSDWSETSDWERRHVIIMYTDAFSHPLGTAPINRSVLTKDALTDKWRNMDRNAKKLILFTPDIMPWNEIARNWDKVTHKKNIIGSSDFDDILDGISDSLE